MSTYSQFCVKVAKVSLPISNSVCQENGRHRKTPRLGARIWHTKW